MKEIKDEVIPARYTGAEVDLIDRAAEIKKWSRAQFIREASVETAERVLAYERDNNEHNGKMG